jgi:hypothetical protein
MTAPATSSVNYAALEKEWLSLASPEEKSDFWERMRLLFADLNSEEIGLFFEQLQKSAVDITLRLELAAKRAEMAGFKLSD